MSFNTLHLLTSDERIKLIIRSLPRLEEALVPKDDSCPICLLPFSATFNDGLAISEGTEEYAGITKITQCGHMFCRRDLAEWIKGMHGTCPTCRHPFLDIQPPSESDDESSDGDYVPEFEYDTDGFTDDGDFDQADMEREMMELDAMDDSEYQAYMAQEITPHDVERDMRSDVELMGPTTVDDEGLSTADLDWLLENECASSPLGNDFQGFEGESLGETSRLPHNNGDGEIK